MPAVHFTNLLIVVAAGLLAPLALSFFPRVRLPAIVLGIVIGPSGLGWVTPDLPDCCVGGSRTPVQVASCGVRRCRVITAEDRALSRAKGVASAGAMP